MLERRDTYDALYKDFSWRIPERFNIGTAVADKWAAIDPDRPALYDCANLEKPRTLTFGQLTARSNSFAQALRAIGVEQGDRVALLLPQSFETVIAHVAIYKLGAIAVPLALLFGADALQYRLASSGAKVVITNTAGAALVQGLRTALPDLKTVIGVEDAAGADLSFQQLIDANTGSFDAVDTGPDDPALMIFTSGTTGPPKGALHGHRVLLGHLPGAEMAYSFLPQSNDVMWTPADWAWAGGLLNALLPALYHGVPVAFGRFQRFDPEAALRLMEAMRVTLAFLPPTAIRMMKNAAIPVEHHRLNLRAVMSAGEQLGRDTYDWAAARFGVTVNEFYGQTECNLVLGSCAELGVSRAGVTGKAVPGHRVAVIDADGAECAPGTVGQIAVQRPDPVMFLGYWRDEAATARKFIGDWMMTGDQGHVDPDGYFHFFGRDDDVITSAGYRIGPGEIEDCLSSHPAVQLAAAVGKPDAVRTEIVKAYVVLRDGVDGNAALADELKLWVRDRLSAHEYPREVEFVSEIPLTTTGKVIRRIFRDKAKAESGQTASG